ncbi:ADP-ribosylation factor-like protein 2 [Pseudolycoriella hygida]|uniref:ADP-ribosylation factor-like protein 2 n=1 Tax=Pseudolycoriella hygida TaxID=35572 RepID=A0A9Q0MVP4_9DIPT|nr:ADP-ribosylation factor-like protein 2 [Pseudolycoriella hygida]
MSNPPTIGWNTDMLPGGLSSTQEIYPRLPSKDSDDKSRKCSSGSKHKRSSSSSSSSSKTSSDSSDTEKRYKYRVQELDKTHEEKERLRKEQKKQRKQEKREKKEYKKAKKLERKLEKKLEKKQRKMERKASYKCTTEEAECGPPISLMNTKARAPQTKEDYDKIQSNIRRVVDPETGRSRLIKGDGEILEEIVSRDRHKAINKQATQSDGEFFKSRTTSFLKMGFLTVLKKIRQKEKEMRILLLGLDNAGKTTILKRFNGEPIDTISPTLGFNIKTLEHRGYTLNMWDVGGQKSLRSYWRNYFECTDGLVWVVDSADRMRMETCRDELKVLLEEERLAGATLLVLANKQDLPGALSAQEIKDALELDLITTHHWTVVGVSAVTGNKLLASVDWLLDDIAKRIFTLE